MFRIVVKRYLQWKKKEKLRKAMNIVEKKNISKAIIIVERNIYTYISFLLTLLTQIPCLFIIYSTTKPIKDLNNRPIIRFRPGS